MNNFFYRGSVFFLLVDFSRRGGVGLLAPRYHSNPDMSAAIKLFSFSKTNLDFRGRYVHLGIVNTVLLYTAFQN